ncbi:MAG: hypothetical protein ACREVR_20575 [Burkholderiales bacterium]
MLEWLKSIFSPPRPSGPPETIRVFLTTDRTLTQGSVAVAQDGWIVDSKEQQTIRLFEVEAPQAEQCLLAYRAKLKTEALAGRAFLEMWCRFPGRGEFFSKGLHHAVKGTTDWVSCETPFLLKKGERPDLIKLNLVIEGRGKVWVRDVQLLRTPLR